MTAEPSTPRLVAVAGGPTGRTFALPPGRSKIGRDEGASICLDDGGVSRFHAVLDRHDARVSVHDLDSRNGTWLNRRRLSGPSELHDGDLLQLGQTVLRFEGAARGTATPGPGAGVRTQAYHFGDVGGPVQVGNGTQFVAGRDQYHAGRDQVWDHSIQVSNDYDASDEIFSGAGPGRLLAVVGTLLALAGFGLFMYSIITAGSGSTTLPTDPAHFTASAPGMPAGILPGLALFLVGGVLSGVGTGMSKAQRKRQERARRDVDRRSR